MARFKISDFANYKNTHRKITMLTAYDCQHAEIIAESPIDIVLIGDSLGMVVQGKDNTLSVTLKDIIYHSQAVRRGAPDCFILADMPYLTYHLDTNTTIKNAGKLISAGAADAVKLEVNNHQTLKHISALVAAQIPVVAHIGMTPQSVNVFGGFKLQGKTQSESEHITNLAAECQNSGASAIVIECVPAALARQLTQNLAIATIGIGAGKDCDGQVLVLNDLLGLTTRPPKFVKQYMQSRKLILQALTEFNQDVQDCTFPAQNNSFN